MHGNVVHYWPYPEAWVTPGAEAVEKHARLLEDGTLLRGAINRTGLGGMSGAIYQLYDWDGEVIWEHDEERPGYTPHHDFRMIWNPKLQAQTLLYVASREITHEQAIALGVDPAKRDDYTSRPDGVVEVDMDGKRDLGVEHHRSPGSGCQRQASQLRRYQRAPGENGSQFRQRRQRRLDPHQLPGLQRDARPHRGQQLDFQRVLRYRSRRHVRAGGSRRKHRARSKRSGRHSVPLGANPCVYDAGECPEIDQRRTVQHQRASAGFLHP